MNIFKIITDGWAAYKKLSEAGFLHDSVNHSLEFVRSDDPSVHTNTVEGQWWCVKRHLPSSGRYSLQSHLPVYMWTQRCAKEGKNVFWELLDLVGASLKNLVNIEDVDASSDEDVIIVNADNPVEQFFCIFCESSFVTEEDVVHHMNDCQTAGI